MGPHPTANCPMPDFTKPLPPGWGPVCGRCLGTHRSEDCPVYPDDLPRPAEVKAAEEKLAAERVQEAFGHITSRLAKAAERNKGWEAWRIKYSAATSVAKRKRGVDNTTAAAPAAAAMFSPSVAPRPERITLLLKRPRSIAGTPQQPTLPIQWDDFTNGYSLEFASKWGDLAFSGGGHCGIRQHAETFAPYLEGYDFPRDLAGDNLLVSVARQYIASHLGLGNAVDLFQLQGYDGRVLPDNALLTYKVPDEEEAQYQELSAKMRAMGVGVQPPSVPSI